MRKNLPNDPLAVLAACLSGCALLSVGRPAAAPAGTGGTVVAQWVEVVSYSVNAPDGGNAPLLLARAIVDAPPGTAPCPAISINGAALEMHARETNRDPVHFPVLVCEALVPSDARSVSIAGGAAFTFFPIDFQNLANRIYVIGDTGCRGVDGHRCQVAQSPYPPGSWAFPGLSADIATHGSPSLIVHVGDYLYRQTPEQTGCPPDLPCDTWGNWQADFFAPAAALLRKAPWIFTRGNHEECASTPLAWGGTGWFLFLDPHSACVSPGVAAPACTGGPPPPDCNHGNAQYPIPYAVDVGFQSAGQASTLRMIVLDSIYAADTPAHKTYDPQFRAMQSLAAGARQAWVLSHKPLWGISSLTGNRPTATQSQDLQQSERDYPLPGNVQLFLSGHIHAFEELTVGIRAQSLPIQVVVGGSGVNLLETLGGIHDVSTRIQADEVFAGQPITGHIRSDHGFAVFTPAAPGANGFAWQGSYRGSSDHSLFEFMIAAPGARSTRTQVRR
ncbi:MAG TPA: metallophosphoesterase [Candidatus Acidoferrales bacterium]|nr:metallophosphoesterase [Candidatus Acidoferrales bacterium]